MIRCEDRDFIVPTISRVRAFRQFRFVRWPHFARPMQNRSIRSNPFSMFAKLVA
jgi:hypothetical protein